MDNERQIDVACGGGCRREAVYGQDGMGPFSRALKRGLDVFLGSAGLPRVPRGVACSPP